MPTKPVNRDGSTVTLDQRELKDGESPRQWLVMLGVILPTFMGTDFIGTLLGMLDFGIDGEQYQVEFDWLNGGNFLVTANTCCVSVRRGDADPNSIEAIQVSGDIQANVGELLRRPVTQPQKTLMFDSIGMGETLVIGTLPKFASKIIGVNATLLFNAKLSLRQARNDETTIVSETEFAQASDFNSADIPLVSDCTRIIGVEAMNVGNSEVQNGRVTFELALP